MIPLVSVIVGMPLVILLTVTDAPLVVVAAVKTSEGAPFTYPLTVRFIG